MRRFLIKSRLVILRAVASVLLPKGVWIGKHFGPYTQRWDVVFGTLDQRGVVQGASLEEIAHPK